MSDTLTRRNMLGRAGLVLGGAMTLGVLNACGGDDAATPTPDPTPTPTPDAGPQVSQFPYQQHLAADYRLDVAAIAETAYHGYYAAGCCHGAYNGLVKHLAETAGAPFNLLALDFGGFGGGGIAGYGSICGAVLGGVLVINSIVPNTAPQGATAAQSNVRNRMMVELMRWYEGFAFPRYVPATVDAKETGLTKDFGAANLAVLQTVPGSHLCHASVTGWCAANGNLNPNGGDKKARCARLTADVAGKVAEMLNGYLATGAFTAETTNTTTTCVSCHGAVTSGHAAPTASGMMCQTCHAEAAHPVPHVMNSGCSDCH
ncbi:MAG TPA: C-GCAxxG-C-C family protein [Anaeromyxobacteraceae bacterium]|nr:C-GCAxxG-C-C family protein [Anaeromyxobacteraceae bacterium]